MGGWGSGPGMIQEPELEEGEACYYKDDTSNDPDIYLSYIEDKVQSVLGHLRKDFEGDISAENLGPKYGGYGTFLPVHQRSQPKSPQRFQNSNLPGSPNNLFPEGPALKSVKVPDAPSTQRNTPLPSDQVSETLPGKVELLPNKADNSINHRTLKVRIKVGPDRMAQYNAELDSLGLASPLSSAENSSDESGGLPFESYTNPSNSPTYILQIMTSFPVPGGSLLSPLSENLLNLVKETYSSKSSAISDGLLKTNVSESKKTKSVDISKKTVKSENGCTLDLNEYKEKNSGSQTLDCIVQPFHNLNDRHLSDSHRESENKVQLRKTRGSKDRVKGREVSSDLVKPSLEHISDQSRSKHMQRESKCDSAELHRGIMSQKDSAADHGQESRSDTYLNRASLRAYSDISEGRRIRGALDKTSVKVLQPAAGEEDGLEVPRTLNKLSLEKKSKVSQSSGKLASKLADSLRHDENAAPKNKCSAKKDVQRPKLVPERPSGGRPKNLDLEAAKAKSAYSDKLKERSNNRKYFDNLTSQTYMAEPPAAAISSNLGTNIGLEQTVAPLDLDEWVECDECGVWRLLPCGIKPKDLPDMWVCSMQEWIPGMNRCGISEDETTTIIRNLYPTPPVPGNQFNFQAHADKTMSGVSSAVAQRFDQNQQNFASDQIPNLVKKQKWKEMHKPASMNDPVSSSNGKKNLKWRVLKGSSKEVNQSFAGEIASNKSDLQHSNKSPFLLAKSNKRKDDHVIGDDANPKKKIRKESFQHVDGMVTKIKSKGALNLENNVSHSLTSGLPNKESLKEGMKKNLQQDSVSGGKGKIQIYLKKPKDQMHDLPDNGREVSSKKRKLIDREDSQHQIETLQNNESDLQQRKRETKDSGIHREEKSRGSKVEENEFKKYKVDDVSKRKCAEARVRLTGSKENPINSGIEKEQVRKLRAKPQLTLEDIDKLRKDLGCEQLSRAANSSSSKVSDSCKIRISYVKVRGSPQESVSSSPARIPNPDQISMETFGKVNSSTEYFSAIGSAKKCLDLKPNVVGSSIKQISGQKEPWNGKVRLDLRQRDKNGAPCPSKHTTSLGSQERTYVDSRQFDSSVIGDTSKVIKDKSIACHQNGSDNFVRLNEAEQSVALDTSLANKNFSNNTASTALKEAEDVLREAEELKVHANLIKNSGFSSESNYEYFKAGLKFLQGASLLEACNCDSSKHMEMNPVQMYVTAAKICKACASDFEKGHQSAAAAIAYKCVEVAYLRVVNCKSSTMYRVWHDLQSTLQMVPQGESPSSSASDVDNFNNLAMADRNTLSKGNVSHFGNQVLLPRNRPNFVRLLDFTKDMNFAMEATKKSQDTFAAARVKLEESRNKEGIVSVKSVIDFSFQDVDKLIRLIWLALNAINKQGLGGFRD